MILRLFIALLALNCIAFVVRAEASERPLSEPLRSERMLAERNEMVSVAETRQLQEWMAGDYEEDARQEALTAIGSRLISLGFSRAEKSGKTYASDPAMADHGFALLNEGACLNLRWKF
ncbi:hypothetical protein C7H09_06715 [Marinobacter fuscus]|uniref:Uncharacterized protein n=1 Tax=Marinobacter fuscus TaxID=2109942 RepID=A0A2T1KKG8_9GAMM|nr:hypothetical protein [Marinobacter fuscus]PSF10629.1 hypothetical protein C7H09_06715 [Marinobacter fuscus]